MPKDIDKKVSNADKKADQKVNKADKKVESKSGQAKNVNVMIVKK